MSPRRFTAASSAYTHTVSRTQRKFGNHPLTEKSLALGFVDAVWIAKLHSCCTGLRERLYLPDYVFGICRRS